MLKYRKKIRCLFCSSIASVFFSCSANIVVLLLFFSLDGRWNNPPAKNRKYSTTNRRKRVNRHTIILHYQRHAVVDNVSIFFSPVFITPIINQHLILFGRFLFLENWAPKFGRSRFFFFVLFVLTSPFVGFNDIPVEDKNTLQPFVNRINIHMFVFSSAQTSIP